MNIAFIPIRCGSKSIPFKNIKIFCGKPLVYWSLKALEEAPSVEIIYVATDCNEIEDIVSSFDFKKVNVYRRSKENASDTASTESAVIEFIEENNISNIDNFILVQATSPLTQSKDFEEAIKLYSTEESDSLLTCVRTKKFFWNEKGTSINYDYKKRPRRQDFDGVLMENGAFYINKVENILRDENRLSGKIAIHEMEEFTAVEIDEEDDWLIAEQLMKKHILSKQ